MRTVQSYIKWFNDISLAEIDEVGGKNASLGELYRRLSPLGVPVPGGFAVAQAYRDLLAEKLRDTLAPVGGTEAAAVRKALSGKHLTFQ